MVKVCTVLGRLLRGNERRGNGGECKATYHAVTGILRISLENTVCCRIITSGVHGIGASLVERSWKPDIASRPVGNSNFRHCESTRRCMGNESELGGEEQRLCRETMEEIKILLKMEARGETYNGETGLMSFQDGHRWKTSTVLGPSLSILKYFPALTAGR